MAGSGLPEVTAMFGMLVDSGGFLSGPPRRLAFDTNQHSVPKYIPSSLTVTPSARSGTASFCGNH